MTVLTVGVLLGVARVLWGERAKPRFGLSLALITIIHIVGLVSLRRWFPLSNMWYLGALAVVEIGFFVVVAYKVMGLYKDE